MDHRQKRDSPTAAATAPIPNWDRHLQRCSLQPVAGAGQEQPWGSSGSVRHSAERSLLPGLCLTPWCFPGSPATRSGCMVQQRFNREHQAGYLFLLLLPANISTLPHPVSNSQDQGQEEVGWPYGNPIYSGHHPGNLGHGPSPISRTLGPHKLVGTGLHARPSRQCSLLQLPAILYPVPLHFGDTHYNSQQLAGTSIWNPGFSWINWDMWSP